MRPRINILGLPLKFEALLYLRPLGMALPLEVILASMSEDLGVPINALE